MMSNSSATVSRTPTLLAVRELSAERVEAGAPRTESFRLAMLDTSSQRDSLVEKIQPVVAPGPPKMPGPASPVAYVMPVPGAHSVRRIDEDNVSFGESMVDTNDDASLGDELRPHHLTGYAMGPSLQQMQQMQQQHQYQQHQAAVMHAHMMQQRHQALIHSHGLVSAPSKHERNVSLALFVSGFIFFIPWLFGYFYLRSPNAAARRLAQLSLLAAALAATAIFVVTLAVYR